MVTSSPESFEPFVDSHAAAAFLGVSATFLTRLARNGQIPAHPLPAGKNGLRRTWRFRLSELREFMEQRQSG